MNSANQLLKESLSVCRIIVSHNLDQLGVPLRNPNILRLYVVNLDSEDLIAFFHRVVPWQDWNQDFLHEVTGLERQLRILCDIVHAWPCLNNII